MQKFLRSILADKSLPPLERIRRLNKWFKNSFQSNKYTLGCPVGNFAQEMGDTSKVFQAKIKTSIDIIVKYFSDVLREAQDLGHLSNPLIQIRLHGSFLTAGRVRL